MERLSELYWVNSPRTTKRWYLDVHGQERCPPPFTHSCEYWGFLFISYKYCSAVCPAERLGNSMFKFIKRNRSTSTILLTVAHYRAENDLVVRYYELLDQKQALVTEMDEISHSLGLKGQAPQALLPVPAF